MRDSRSHNFSQADEPALLADQAPKSTEQLRINRRLGGQRRIMIEVGVTDLMKIIRGLCTAHLMLELSFDSVADVGQRFFHPLDMRARYELSRLVCQLVVELKHIREQVAMCRMQ